VINEEAIKMINFLIEPENMGAKLGGRVEVRRRMWANPRPMIIEKRFLIGE